MELETNKKMEQLDRNITDCSNFTRGEASIYLQGKLYGKPSVLQQAIFEAVYRIEHGDYDIQKVLEWYIK